MQIGLLLKQFGDIASATFLLSARTAAAVTTSIAEASWLLILWVNSWTRVRSSMPGGVVSGLVTTIAYIGYTV